MGTDIGRHWGKKKMSFSLHINRAFSIPLQELVAEGRKARCTTIGDHLSSRTTRYFRYFYVDT